MQIPDFEIIEEKANNGEYLTAVELFVLNHQPATELECYQWYADLGDLISEVGK